jgi:hypothetical protein
MKYGRVHHRRLDRLELQISPESALGPACPKCGGPHAERIRIVHLRGDGPLPECEVCGRLLHPERGHPLRTPVVLVRSGTRMFDRSNPI